MERTGSNKGGGPSHVGSVILEVYEKTTGISLSCVALS